MNLGQTSSGQLPNWRTAPQPVCGAGGHACRAESRLGLLRVGSTADSASLVACATPELPFIPQVPVPSPRPASRPACGQGPTWTSAADLEVCPT
jgi:hypothetical protein